MSRIELICIGDLKFRGLKEVEQDYVRKINFFCPFVLRPIKDIKSTDEVVKIKKEGELMGKMLDPRCYVIALDQYGKKMDSLGFSAYLSEKMVVNPAGIIFLIGGHAGLSPQLDKRIDLKLSFSDMTFGHDIFRVLFLEQLYRAFTIIKNIKYHR